MIVSRDVYGLHPYELTPDRVRYCRTFIALRRLQQKAEADAIKRVGSGAG